MGLSRWSRWGRWYLRWWGFSIAEGGHWLLPSLHVHWRNGTIIASVPCGRKDLRDAVCLRLMRWRWRCWRPPYRISKRSRHFKGGA